MTVAVDFVVKEGEIVGRRECQQMQENEGDIKTHFLRSLNARIGLQVN